MRCLFCTKLLSDVCETCLTYYWLVLLISYLQEGTLVVVKVIQFSTSERVMLICYVTLRLTIIGTTILSNIERNSLDYQIILATFKKSYFCQKKKKSSYISTRFPLHIIHAFFRILSNAVIKHSPHSLDDTNTIDASLALVRYRGFRRSSQFLSLPTVAVIFTTLFLSHPLNSRGKLRYNAILSISPITIYFTPTWIP